MASFRHRLVRVSSLIGILAGLIVSTSSVLPVAAASGSAYTPQNPTRILDTRVTGGTLGTAGSLNLTVAGGTTGVPATATGVVLNVTVTNTSSSGALTVWQAGQTRNLVSNLNWVAGETRANLVNVPVGTNGQVSIYNFLGNTDVVVDEEGYFAAQVGSAGGYNSLTPSRLLDTRLSAQTMATGSVIDLQVTGMGGVPATGVSAVVLNATATNTATEGFFTLYPSLTTKATVSNVNWKAGWTIPNRVIVGVGTNGKVAIYNGQGSADAVIDVSGYFTDSTRSGSLFTPLNPVRALDTRNAGGTLGPNGVGTLQVTGSNTVPSGATAAFFNTTVTNTSASSALTVYPGPGRPLSSDLNWVAGQTIPNATVATLSATGSTNFYNFVGSTDVVFDLSGYFGGFAAGTNVRATPSSVPADGATTSSVTATVTKADGTPATSDAVTFSKSASVTGSCGGLSATTGITNSLGQVTITYTASTTVGTCTITARDANFSGVGTDVITQTTPPNSVSVAPAAAAVAANGSSTQTLTVTVLDSSGVALSGDTVNLVASGTCGSVNPATGTTNSSGQLTTVYISSTATGFCTVTATETGSGASGTSVIDQTTSPAPVNSPYVVAAVTFNPNTLPADGTSTATASTFVRDSTATLVNGDLVRFSKGAGCKGVLLNGGSSAIVATSSLGLASVTYTAGTVVGGCVITATEAATNAFNVGTETQSAVPNTVTVNAVPSTIANSGVSTSTVTATVTSPSGVLVVGSSVSFVGAPTPLGACGSITGSPATTNSSGQAAVAYISSTTAGFCKITATDNGTGAPAGVAGGKGTVTINQTSTSGNTTTGAANPASIPADGATTSTVTATVKDSGGAAVPGDTVSFTKSSACTSGTQSAGTNALGVATITYTASLTVGTCTITATEANGGSSATITITQTAPLNVVTLTPGTATLAANGSSTRTFTATVSAFSGVSVVGDSVTFTVSGSPAGACGTMNPPSGTTNSSGQVTSVYISSSTSGFCTVIAADNGTGTPAGPSGSGKAVIDQTTSPAPANIPYTVAAVTFVPATLPADGTSTATASTTVRNNLAVGVAGDTVRFTKGAGCTGALLNGASSATATTNASGVASVTYTAGTAVGTCFITATEASTGVANTTGGEPQSAVPNTISANAVPSSVTANGTSSSTITILVNNNSGNPVAEVVNIAKVGTPAAACGTLPANATTNASGQATVVYISSSTSGFCNITITDVTGGTVTIQITQTP